MTGTSLDGVDAALVKIEGHGLGMQVAGLDFISHPLCNIAEPLRDLSQQHPMTSGQLARLTYDLSDIYLTAIRQVAGNRDIALISVHGQTVFHDPPLSWQLINPSVIAHKLGIPVVFDLRAADLAMGGQGAPITPLADSVLFRNTDEKRCIVNLGGFCNVTFLPACPSEDVKQYPTKISGGDVCVCNQLLNEIARELMGKPYDDNGREASCGEIRDKPYESLFELLQNQSRAGRSLGTGDELDDWLAKFRDNYSTQDLARTACGAIAGTISRRCDNADRLILAGGGVLNKTLVREINERSRSPVTLSADYSVPPQYREAVAMAVLGALCQDRIPITLPQITGAKVAPISGCWVLP